MNLSKAFRRIALGSMLGTSAILVSTQALAAFQFHVAVKGKKQGQFKGEGVDKRRDRWMPGLSFSWAGTSPRDVTSGQPSGKRQYQQMCFVKQWGPASPQLLTAWATNELLTEVNFEFTKTSPNGEEYVYQTIKLVEATVAKFNDFTPATAADLTKRTASDTATLEELCLTFRHVEIENKDGKTMFIDDWNAPI